MSNVSGSLYVGVTNDEVSLIESANPKWPGLRPTGGNEEMLRRRSA